jgi:hypothetical protein
MHLCYYHDKFHQPSHCNWSFVHRSIASRELLFWFVSLFYYCYDLCNLFYLWLVFNALCFIFCLGRLSIQWESAANIARTRSFPWMLVSINVPIVATSFMAFVLMCDIQEQMNCSLQWVMTICVLVALEALEQMLYLPWDHISESTQRLLSLANKNANHSVGVQQPSVIVEASGRRNQQQLAYHSLPPGVKVHNKSAADGLKCHFTKQSKCKFKNSEIVICIRCENAVHVQCFLHLILDSKDNKVSNDVITWFADFYFISNLNYNFS